MRILKEEEIYLHDYRDPVEAQHFLARVRHYYNYERPHDAPNCRFPADVFCRQSNARSQSPGSAP